MTFLIVVLALLATIVLGVFFHLWHQAKGKQELARSDWEGLMNRASYLQSCITLMALILGGGWGLYTWAIQWEEHKKNASEAELISLQINVSAHQEFPPKTNQRKEFFIAGKVIFKNTGTRRTTIRLADGPLFVSQIYSSKIGSGTLKHPNELTDQSEREAACDEARTRPERPLKVFLSRPSVDGRPDIEVQAEIRPGEEDEFHFILRVQHRGTYAVIFSSEISEDEEKRAQPIPENLGPCIDKNRKPMKPRWESAAAFVEVK
jgi:hypothetical protein